MTYFISYGNYQEISVSCDCIGFGERAGRNIRRCHIRTCTSNKPTDGAVNSFPSSLYFARDSYDCVYRLQKE
jgi:hypothetical protein